MGDDDPRLGLILMELLGGLAIFLIGMDQLTSAMRNVAGARLKDALARLTTSRLRAVLTGTFVTASIQSSSVTTVLLVGFVSAGLLSLEQSIGVIMGAEIGTTITAQIVAFKVTKLALLAIFVGFIMQIAFAKGRLGSWGTVVVGFGFVFFGMNVMGDATKPLRTYEPFIALMQSIDRPIYGILLSAAFTAIVQSSSATTGVIIVLASQGLITLEAGIALVLGANIGTCVTALLASIGKPREALRTACVHVTFNVAGVTLWLGFIGYLAQWVTYISPPAEGLEGEARRVAELPRQIANAHTTFNVVNTAIFIWFTPVIAWFVRTIVPERAVTQADGIQPKYLDENLFTTPSLALDRVRLETGRVSERAADMVRAAGPDILLSAEADVRRLEALDDDVDALHGAIVRYLGRLSREPLSERDTRTVRYGLAIVNYFESIADLVETNVAQAAREARTHEVRPGERTAALLAELHAAILGCVETAAAAVDAGSDEKAKTVIDAKDRINRLSDRAEQHLVTRLSAEDPHRLSTFRVETTLIEAYKHSYYFAKRIAKVVIALNQSAGAPEPEAGEADDPALVSRPAAR